MLQFVPELERIPLIKECGFIEGSCGPLVLAAAKKIISLGETALTIHHRYGYEWDDEEWGHFFIEKDGVVIDPSWRQFNLNAPIVNVSTLDEYAELFPIPVSKWDVRTLRDIKAIQTDILGYLLELVN